MTFDFDMPVARRGTNCIKYDFYEKFGAREDCIPLWVADMDFLTAPCIREALGRMVEHGIFGYSGAMEGYFRAVIGWYEEHFSWRVQKEWIVQTPGVVFALANAVRAYTEPGDAVMICQPVYYPFSNVITTNGRRVVNSDLLCGPEGYEMDFSDIDARMASEKVKMFILCSPHNPVGRVWRKEELVRLEELCLAHGVVLVSDEIHSDFVWEGHTHYPLLSLSGEYEKNTIVCTAPSKSFNTAGLQCSNIVIPNEDLRRRFTEAMSRTGLGGVSLPGLVATQAAYEGGGEWLRQLKQYIYANITFMRRGLEENLPQLKMMPIEGTYLTWVDFRALGMSEEERQDFLLNKAKLWLDSGAMFGKAGEGFERFNVACTRATLEKAMGQLKAAVEGI